MTHTYIDEPPKRIPPPVVPLAIATVILAIVLGIVAHSNDASSAVFSTGFIADFHSLTPAELSSMMMNLLRSNPAGASRLRDDVDFRYQQLDHLKQLLTLANEEVRTNAVGQPPIRAELENIRVEIVATGFEKLKYPSANILGSSVTEEEKRVFENRPTFKAELNAFLDAKLRRAKKDSPSFGDHQITDEERFQAADLFAITRILAARAASDSGSLNPKESLNLTTTVKLQQAQFLAREYTDTAAETDHAPITAEDIRLYRKTNGVTARTSDETVRSSIREDRLNDTISKLVESSDVDVPEDFDLGMLDALSNTNAPRRIGNTANTHSVNSGARNTRIH